jgi:hypothetical protein
MNISAREHGDLSILVSDTRSYLDSRRSSNLDLSGVFFSLFKC